MMTKSMLNILLKARRLKSQYCKNELPIFDDFSFLRSRETIKYIRSSKVMFIMRGLPGSGKSTLVRAIKTHYKEAVVCSADSFFVQKDGSYAFDVKKLPKAHEECADLAQKAAEMSMCHIVVDNTNVLRWEMGKYFRLASEYGYAVIVVEPKTPWKLEPVELAAKNIHGCTAELVKQKMKKFKAVLPVYWGWFFDETVASELLTLGETYFDLCMKTVPEFASYMNELGVSKGLTLPLSFKEFYNRPKGSLLHCTSFFNGGRNHQLSGTDEYADRPEVQRSMGKAFSLKLVGITFSPRTVGIRVVLNRLQLSLWGAEDVWFRQPPPKPKNEDVDQSTDGLEVLTQDAPNVQKPKKDRKWRRDTSKALKRDEIDTQNGVNEVNLTDFLQEDVEHEVIQKCSQLNISGHHQPLEGKTSNLLENTTNTSASNICPEPAQNNNPASGDDPGSDEVPRIQLKQGSRAHITLGCAEGYGAVQTGFDQMEILLCEDDNVMVGESVVMDDVEIAYYGEGRCTVYFDWPIYKSALFTGKY